MWEVQLYGQIEQADLTTLQSWLLDRRIEPATLVRFGKQPWIPAQNVPALQQICVGILQGGRDTRAKAALPHTSPGGESQRNPAIPGTPRSALPASFMAMLRKTTASGCLHGGAKSE